MHPQATPPRRPQDLRRLRARIRALAASLGLVLAAAVTCTPASAQALFTEDFDNLGTFVGGQEGPASLEQQGWIFRVQSGAVLAPTVFDYGWRSGPYNVITGGFSTFDAQAGSGCLATDHNTAEFNQGVVQASNWAILPPIAGQSAGDELTFWARQETSLPFQILEVRYSASGGTSTGSSMLDVGDFTFVLASIAPPSGASWQFHSVNLPGSGRIAIRYFLPDSQWGNAQVVGIDTLAVGPPMGPCPNYPIIPAAGQTVHWTAADSPHEICSATVIPQGATVIVDPGAVVQIEDSTTLEIYGDLQVSEGASIDVPFDGSVLIYGTASLTGTSANPVILSGGGRSVAPFAKERFGAMPGGRIVADHVDLSTVISAIGTGVVTAEHITAHGTRKGFYVSGEPLYYGGTLAVRHSEFTDDAQIASFGGYLLIDDCVFDNATFRPGRPRAGQSMHIDNIIAVNRPNDSVFHLYGADFNFGSGNLISANRYPVMLEAAGLVSGSVLPSSGNTFNRVHSLPSAEGLAHFGQIGIPYEVEGNNSVLGSGGKIIVSPGVTIKMAPNAGIGANLGTLYGSPLELEGLPSAPIVIEALDPLQPWDNILYGANPYFPRVEHTIFRGGNFGLGAEQNLLRVESCTFEDNLVGLDSYLEGRIEARGCRFFNNRIGARSSNEGIIGNGKLSLDARGYPNWFEGNFIGLETTNVFFAYDDARDNYWGHPSGPADELNPQGLGDPTPGTNNVIPFRTSPPIANFAPVVRLEKHSDLLEEGQKLILHWTASDDDTITGFRILHSPHGENPGFSVIATGIPGNARSWEIVIPPAPPASNYPDPSALRVEATDSFGQTGYDHIVFRTPALQGYTGRFQPDPILGVRRPGEIITPCGQWQGSANAGSGYDLYIWLDGDDQIYPLGNPGNSTCSFDTELPPFSTDTARFVAIHTGGAGGQVAYGFSDYFEIRPDPAIGDAPPQITLSSPLANNLYLGSGRIPVTWRASDDEALRSFDIHASYDDGRTWHTVKRDLPPNRRSYLWSLPPSTGIEDVRVRVIARDLRFQNTSATSDRFSILPGTPPIRAVGSPAPARIPL